MCDSKQPFNGADSVSTSTDYEMLRIVQNWPTPARMRAAGDALDMIAPARYGAILWWMADQCDKSIARWSDDD